MTDCVAQLELLPHFIGLVLVLRAAWLLPDWLAKWRLLFGLKSEASEHDVHRDDASAPASSLRPREHLDRDGSGPGG